MALGLYLPYRCPAHIPGLTALKSAAWQRLSGGTGNGAGPDIAARTKPRFIEIEPEQRTKLRRTNDWLFIEIPRERGGAKVPFAEEQLTAMRGRLTVERYVEADPEAAARLVVTTSSCRWSGH